MVQDLVPPPQRYVRKFAKSDRPRFKSRYSRVNPYKTLCKAWVEARGFKLVDFKMKGDKIECVALAPGTIRPIKVSQSFGFYFGDD